MKRYFDFENWKWEEWRRCYICGKECYMNSLNHELDVTCDHVVVKRHSYGYCLEYKPEYKRKKKKKTKMNGKVYKEKEDYVKRKFN